MKHIFFFLCARTKSYLVYDIKAAMLVDNFKVQTFNSANNQ